MLTRAVHRLIMSGWTYLLVSVDDGGQTPSNQAVEQVLTPRRPPTNHLASWITADSTDWNPFDFERGPLVYTNDVLYDILARHVSDFDNPPEFEMPEDVVREKQLEPVEDGMKELEDRVEQGDDDGVDIE